MTVVDVQCFMARIEGPPRPGTMVEIGDQPTMPDDITAKVALVTGASRGIGRAIAVALAAAGADVAVNYRSREKDASQTAAEIRRRGRRAIAVQADVSVAAKVAGLVAAVEAELGPVAILGRCLPSSSVQANQRPFRRVLSQPGLPSAPIMNLPAIWPARYTSDV